MASGPETISLPSRRRIETTAAEITEARYHPARDVLALCPKAWKQQLQDSQAR